MSGTTSVSPGKRHLHPGQGRRGLDVLPRLGVGHRRRRQHHGLQRQGATGGGSYFYLVGRRVGTNTEYRAIVHLLASGAVGVSFTKLTGSSTETVVKAETTVPGLTYTAGTASHIRAQVTGTNPTTLRIRAWTGSSESTTWAATATDTSSVLQAAGGVGLRAYISGSTTNAPTTFSIKNFTAQPTVAGGGTTNLAPVATFTASCAALSCNFDGSGSTDSDGSVASYAWSFGDGSTGTGATVSHVYSAAGTFTATLTVTDNQGATNAVQSRRGPDGPGRADPVRVRRVQPHREQWLGQRRSGRGLDRVGHHLGQPRQRHLHPGQGRRGLDV